MQKPATLDLRRTEPRRALMATLLSLPAFLYLNAILAYYASVWGIKTSSPRKISTHKAINYVADSGTSRSGCVLFRIESYMMLIYK